MASGEGEKEEHCVNECLALVKECACACGWIPSPLGTVISVFWGSCIQPEALAQFDLLAAL